MTTMIYKYHLEVVVVIKMGVEAATGMRWR